MPSIELHGREYQVPSQPVVVVCIDGFDPEYLEAGSKAGILPTMTSWVDGGFHKTAKCVMPSVTNPNNLSIITGVPTSVHGISGNYYLDSRTGEEITVVDASTMRGETILERMANAGVRVAAITAKDKLRKIINHGLSPAKGAICFSSQYAGTCSLEEHGIEDVEKWLGQAAPEQYSGELSLFVLDAGLKLLQEKRADLFYLTLSDFIQHMHAPGSAQADHFLQEIDTRLGEFEKLGAIVAVTGDHGMSDKSDEKGEPRVLYLEDFLHERWPEAKARVICPIADAFVKHHGALGGFVRVHLTGEKTDVDVQEMIKACRALPEVELAVTGAEAAALFEMPEDREGDFTVVSKKNAAVGGRKAEHDLSQLGAHRFRSHGGVSEQRIPLLRSKKAPLTNGAIKSDGWRNFDVFDVALNY